MKNKKEMVNTVYIGYDEKEDTAYETKGSNCTYKSHAISYDFGGKKILLYIYTNDQ